MSVVIVESALVLSALVLSALVLKNDRQNPPLRMNSVSEALP
jgi:hypothetical protein